MIWDENLEPLAGVTVVLPEFNLTTITDENGAFDFEVTAYQQRSVNLIARKKGFKTYDANPTLGNTSLKFILRKNPP